MLCPAETHPRHLEWLTSRQTRNPVLFRLPPALRREPVQQRLLLQHHRMIDVQAPDHFVSDRVESSKGRAASDQSRHSPQRGLLRVRAGCRGWPAVPRG
jgi:hypothetical protein